MFKVYVFSLPSESNYDCGAIGGWNRNPPEGEEILFQVKSSRSQEAWEQARRWLEETGRRIKPPPD